MKSNQYKQNLYKKESRRIKRISKMTPQQQEKSSKKLLDRMKRKEEIRNKIIEMLKLDKDLTLADIQRKLGENRNTFNYWINMFEKEGWFKRKIIEGAGNEITGQPKTLVLNEQKLKEIEQRSINYWKSFEEFNLKNLLTEKILREIEEKKPSDKQHQRLIELFKQFAIEGYGAKLISLLYGNYIKINYRLSLTEKGKKFLKKIKNKK